MILSHHLRFATRRTYVVIAVLVLTLFGIVPRYHVTDSSLTAESASANIFIKPKPVLNLRESSLNGNEAIANANDELHQLDDDFITNNDTEVKITKTFIDIDKVELPINVLYEKLTLVTGFSQNHFKEGIGFIGSAQQQMPNKTIIVYDLGLDENSLNTLRQFCNVEVRRFHFENYPAHVKRLHTYAFKPTIINLVLNEFGVIYYGDASIRFKKPLLELLPECVNHHGFLGRIQCFDPKVPAKSQYGCHHNYHLTKNKMYGKIGVNKTEFYNANFSSPSLSGGLMLVVNSTTVQWKIMKPWLQCAMDVTCIAPNGASLGNHRFDQSGLSLIVFKNMRREWTFENDPSPHHNDVVSVLRGSHGANWHPKSCY